ncbi:hypothetical protein HDV05_002605, partial [Chytridiales sp. JEL 0842]
MFRRLLKHPDTFNSKCIEHGLPAEYTEEFRNFLMNPIKTKDNQAEAAKALRNEAHLLLEFITKNATLDKVDAHLQMDSLNDGEMFLMKDIPGVQGHFFKTQMLVRECYWPLARSLYYGGQDRPYCISGDPGIGKSFFAFFMFFVLVRKKEPVMLVSVGGSAFYFDGDTIEFMETPTNVWRLKSTWLLMDGWAPVSPFTDKQSRAIVFASPKQKNYHEFIKNNGIILYMPAWSIAEVNDFVDGVDNDTVMRLIGSLKESPQESGETTVELLSKTVPNGEVSIRAADGSGSNDEDALPCPLLKRILRKRYEVIGGKIRLLLDPSYTVHGLQLLIRAASANVTMANLMHNDTIDIKGSLPSVLYTVIPK